MKSTLKKCFCALSGTNFNFITHDKLSHTKSTASHTNVFVWNKPDFFHAQVQLCKRMLKIYLIRPVRPPFNDVSLRTPRWRGEGGVHVEFYPIIWISEPLGNDSVPREKKVSHIGYLICGRHGKQIYVLDVSNSLEFIVVIIRQRHKWGSTKMEAERLI